MRRPYVSEINGVRAPQVLVAKFAAAMPAYFAKHYVKFIFPGFSEAIPALPQTCSGPEARYSRF